MTPHQVSQIFTDAKTAVTLNNAKLAACKLPHDFSTPINRLTRKSYPPQRSFVGGSVKRGGIIDGDHKRWYELGLSHGK